MKVKRVRRDHWMIVREMLHCLEGNNPRHITQICYLNAMKTIRLTEELEEDGFIIINKAIINKSKRRTYKITAKGKRLLKLSDKLYDLTNSYSMQGYEN